MSEITTQDYAYQQNPKAFELGELVQTVKIKKGMLQSIARVLIDSEDRRINYYGFFIGGLIANIPSKPRVPFFVTDMTREDLVLHIGHSILNRVGREFTKSSNKAVACMGFELIQVAEGLEFEDITEEENKQENNHGDYIDCPNSN